MPAHFSRSAILLFGFLSFAAAAAVFPQESTPPPAGDETYQSQRKFAIALLNQQKYMEALPVFESLAKQNPKDSEVLFGWGACLVNHSATVADSEAARRERVQGRELLLKAKELGNQNGLLMNLLELLPPDGSAPFASATAVDAAMRAGEAAFAKNDYDEAIKNYSRALELDPKNYHAVLFIGDSYFAEKDFPNATIWYDRAIALDPNAETAYRYEADLFIKSGEMEKARSRSIQAVIANPYSNVTWRALNYWANSNHVQLSQPKIKIPGGAERKDNSHITITLDPKASPSTGISAAWLAYNMSHALWIGDNFKKNFPKEPQYRHSLLEESESLRMAGGVLSGKDNRKKYEKEYASDPNVTLLLKLFDTKLIEPYVLISTPDRDIALNDYVPYREQHRDQLEAYLSQFVVPPTPPKPQ